MPQGAPVLAIHGVSEAQERDQPKKSSVGGDTDGHLAAGAKACSSGRQVGDECQGGILH
jgi:hypothetical protein